MSGVFGGSGGDYGGEAGGIYSSSDSGPSYETQGDEVVGAAPVEDGYVNEPDSDSTIALQESAEQSQPTAKTPVEDNSGGQTWEQRVLRLLADLSTASELTQDLRRRTADLVLSAPPGARS